MSPDPVPSVPVLSLVDGGPANRLLERLGLRDRSAPRPARTALALTAFALLPLLFFSALDHVLVAKLDIPLLHDAAVWSRFLVALPVLFIAGAVVGPRLATAAAMFVRTGAVADHERERYTAAVDEAHTLCDSARLEAAILVGAFVMSWVSWLEQHETGLTTWQILGASGSERFSRAGLWYYAVALPTYQFIMYRWLLRFLVWSNFLRRMEALPLRLSATYPEGVGGLGFIAGAHRTLAFLGTAAGAVLAGKLWMELTVEHVPLAELRVTVAAFVAVVLVGILGPLLVFATSLGRAKRQRNREYAELGARYARDFDQRWLGAAASGEPLLGTGDIQSLADLGSAMERVRRMRIVPVSRQAVLVVAAAVLAPLVPLLTVKLHVEDLVDLMLKLAL